MTDRSKDNVFGHASYLGDGVYASFDGWHIWLRTGSHEARDATNSVALEPAVFNALLEYQRKLVETLEHVETEETEP
jgi:hypothetical protein